MVLLHLTERAVVFCSRRLNDDSAEQTVIFVVSQVAEGTEQSGTVFPVGMPQVFSAFPGRNSLLCIVIAHMGNDQLLPAYNVQMGVCDGYIAVYGVYQYASDSDCFQPLMEEFRRIYHKYPKYPVADAGYGNLNNYLYCEEHGMEKYMKFPMYEKETKNKKYRDDPYRAVNFRVNEEGRLVCPNNKEFFFLRTEPVKGNQYGRTVELHQCEDCSGCPHRSKCHKSKTDRIIWLNYELTSFHKEVLENLNSIHGALLPRHPQAPHFPDSHHHFSGHPRSPVLRTGAPYAAGRGRDLVLHSYRLVPG